MSSLPLHLLRSGGGFARDPRFASVFAVQEVDAPQHATPDPVAEAFAHGFAEGAAAAREEAAQAERERDAARGAIELALIRFDEEHTARLRQKLHHTVHALCDEAVLPLALDPVGLAARVERALAMLQRTEGERVLLLHPCDLELIAHRLPAGLPVEADPAVERGALRIETPDGGIEDGPSHWRRLIAEAVQEC